MKDWRDKNLTKVRNSKTDSVRDVFKREILNTRIVISGILREQDDKYRQENIVNGSIKSPLSCI
ncbi:MAG: hypothetical protein WAV41_03015 [Microgenomates group bacterium]